MIKAFLFDFDGVLTVDKTGSTTITAYLSNACHIPLEKVKACYYPFNQKLLSGETTHKEIWPEFCKAAGQDIDFQVLADSFRSTRLDDTMLAIVQKLKESYLIGMVTDNKCDRIDTILEYNGIKPYFDVVAVSAALHAGKNRKEIFEYVLSALKVQADECIFIDNTEKNLEIPRKMGMATIFYYDDDRNYDLFLAEVKGIISRCG